VAGPNVVDKEQLTRARARVGTTLGGKYRLDALLGIGGMAAVYRATHRNNAIFAIKVLHAEYALRGDVRTRFLREGYIANSIQHPGVVRILDDESTVDGGAYIVMELLEGASAELLAARLGERLPVRAVVAIALAVLDILDAAHGTGVIHRDVKPANLFIGHDGRVVLLDFGIARVYDAAQASGLSTAAGAVLGTPAFMAPEQALAQKTAVGPRADLWALGATMFSALTGRTVHLAEGAAEFLVLAATRQAVPVRDLVAEVPPAIAGVLDRALLLDAEERWPSANEMREALVAAAREAYGDVPSRADLTLLFASAAALDKTGESTPIATTQVAREATPRNPTPPPAMKPFFRSVVNTVRGLGVDVAAAMGAAGLPPDFLADEGAQPTNAQLVSFFERAAQLGSEPALGVKVGIALPLGAGGALDYAIRTSSTYREALVRLSDLYNFLSDRVGLDVVEDGENVRLRQIRTEGAPNGPQITEFITSLFLVRSREVLGYALPVVDITFEHARVPGGPDLTGIFGAQVRHEQPHDDIVVPAAVLDRVLQTSDPTLAALLERHTRHHTTRPGG
jgi:serine/threonine protein kinase